MVGVRGRAQPLLGAAEIARGACQAQVVQIGSGSSDVVDLLARRSTPTAAATIAFPHGAADLGCGCSVDIAAADSERHPYLKASKTSAGIPATLP
jgi:hypothetical protein